MKVQIVISAIILLIVIVAVPSIYATHDDAVRLMVIQLGSGCSFCPELEDLIPYDTSKASVSGGFSNDTGTWIREKPVFDQHWKHYTYEYGENIIFVDMYPNLEWEGRSKNIILSDWINARDGNIKQGMLNGTGWIAKYWNSTINRNLTGCDWATIDSRNWQEFLDDTIRYFHHECDPEFTNVETIERVIISNQTTTKQFPIKQWLENHTPTIAEYCKDKYPCVYQYEGPAWIWTVVEWYKADLVSHEELQQMLAWCVYRVTDVLPIYK